ncbi:hypothetical protein [Rosistilla oblonga]|uniref:hypothetical protein n=1 Tax=Rosistilla oblonga TaxID=2527990 RepID=UPI003A96BD7F
MSSVPYGSFRYPGIEGVVSARYTRSLGIQPGVATVTIAPLQPDDKPIARYGDMEWSYGRIRHVMKDCAVDDISQSTSGPTLWTVYILDGRWKWQMGEISGEYNYKREGSGDIEFRSRKNCRELAKLLVEAMGYTDAKMYDIDLMPDNRYTHVKWDVDIPAVKLQELCNKLGFKIAYQFDGSLSIVEPGVGEALPDNGTLVSPQYSVDAVPQPRSYIFTAAPTQWEVDIPLRPVGMDIDNMVRSIQNLSYRVYPKDLMVKGYEWTATQPQSIVIPSENSTGRKYTKEQHEHVKSLAKSTLFRWYKVDLEKFASAKWSEANGFDGLPGLKNDEERKVGDNTGKDKDEDAETEFSLVNLEQILPLIPTLVRERETSLFDKKLETPEVIRAYVWGKYYKGSGGSVNTSHNVECLSLLSNPSSDPENNEALKYNRGFSVDETTGIVKLSDPAWINASSVRTKVKEVPDIVAFDSEEEKDEKIKILPAMLWIRCTINFRHKDSMRYWRHLVSRDGDRYSPAPPMFILRDDIEAGYYRKVPAGAGPQPKPDEEAQYKPTNNNTEDLTWDNIKHVEDVANYYLDQKEKEFAINTPATASYASFVDVRLDGAINQVSFSITAGRESTCVVSRNTEHDLEQLSYQEKVKVAEDAAWARELIRFQARQSRRKQRDKR